MQDIVLRIFLLLLSSFFLALGANYFVEGAHRVAVRFGISQLVIGVTLVALGTSLPEFFVSLVALVRGSSDISVGNVVGSNICNIGLILGVSALVSPVKCNRDIFSFEYPYMMLTAVVVFLLSRDGVLGHGDGVILLGMLLIFIGYFALVKKSPPVEEEVKEVSFPSLPGALFICIAGLLMLLISSEVFVRSAIWVARALGVSEVVIGLSLVALGTSLPELASSLAASLKGKDDIAVGNVLGSNILNIVFILGVLSSFGRVAVERRVYAFDMPYMLGLGLLLFPLMRRNYKIGRFGGILLLIAYGVYIFVIYSKGRI